MEGQEPSSPRVGALPHIRGGCRPGSSHSNKPVSPRSNACAPFPKQPPPLRVLRVLEGRAHSSPSCPAGLHPDAV